MEGLKAGNVHPTDAMVSGSTRITIYTRIIRTMLSIRKQI
jgi:hypothetical protein